MSSETVNLVFCEKSVGESTSKPYIHKENKFGGKYITGKIADEIEAELLKFCGSGVAKSVMIKQSKKEGNVIPAARIVLSCNSTEPINMSDLINGAICKKYRIGSVTFCLPDENETRGIRYRLGEGGTRIYEVANGSYNMTLTWCIEEEECKVEINISDDGSVKLIERNGVTWGQLASHKEVKVGRPHEAKYLYEALSYLNQEFLKQ